MLFPFEFRRFRGLLPVAAVLFVLLVPLLYGAVYLSANWDPYGRLDRLPVAIVNEDTPVEYDGKTLTTGADITSQLIEDHDFDWHETTREDAEAGLAEGRYYLVMEIPSDLSADLVSADGGDAVDPQQAHITLRRDDANGFVIGSVTASSQTRIENAVSQSAVEAYFQAVFAHLTTLRSGMADAADGAGRLAEGAQQADDGAVRLADGLGQAREGSGRLTEGAADAEDASGRLAEGAAQVDDGAAQLAAGTGDAVDGATRLSGGLDEARTGSRQLAEGAGQLDANVPALQDGATALSSGLGELEAGGVELTDGAEQVAAGTQELYDTAVPGLDAVIERQDTVAAEVAAVDERVQSLNEVVTGAGTGVAGGLDDATEQLAALAAENPEVAESPAYAALQESLATAQERAAGVAASSQEVAERSAAADARVQAAVSENVAGQARDDLTRLNEGAHAVAEGAGTLTAGLDEAGEGADALASGVGRFSDGLGALAAGATELDGGLAQLQEGSGQLAEGLGTLDAGAARLAEGTVPLAEGAGQLHTGLGELRSGAGELDSGLGELQDGAGQLQDGLGRLDEGAGELRDGLRDGVDRIPAISEQDQEHAALVMSRPVAVDMDVQNPAEVYGRGMAPMFFSIALWVFGIAAFNVMRPVSGRLLAARRHPLTLTLAAWLPTGLLAMGGSLLMLAATYPLGIAPAHPLHVVGLTLLVAAVFSVIAHLVQTALGTPGSAVLLVLLILQLASTGGTYPMPLLPEFFQWLNPVMPMTHAIDAFRYAISGGLPAQFWTGILFLAILGAAALLLDMVVVRSHQRFRMKDMHPQLEH